MKSRIFPARGVVLAPPHPSPTPAEAVKPGKPWSSLGSPRTPLSLETPKVAPDSARQGASSAPRGTSMHRVSRPPPLKVCPNFQPMPQTSNSMAGHDKHSVRKPVSTSTQPPEVRFGFWPRAHTPSLFVKLKLFPTQLGCRGAPCGGEGWDPAPCAHNTWQHVVCLVTR